MKGFVFDWLEVLVHAIIVVIICFSFLFRVATIDGESMENTLFEGEKVIISNLFYEPKAGDIVVISRNKENSVFTIDSSNTPIIKRIIALEGQTVDIDFDEGIVYVDGIALDEPYTKTPTNEKYEVDFPVTVDEGCIFVLGDNRNESLDSRSSQIGEYGMIDTRYILGHAIFRILPFEKMGGLN
ncbi:MAG: signal peptidase I [Clostridia bacterium]|nr:signal peptidase I [Clostridia bacterium]